MSNTDITRLVVGEPFQKALGSPVTQQGLATDMPPGSTLRWANGRWERDSKSLEAHLRGLKLPSASSITLKAGRPRWMKLPQAPFARFLAQVALAFVLGLPLALYFATSEPTTQPDIREASVADLPLEPRQAQESTGIREVNSSYTPPSDEVPVGGEPVGRVTPTPVQTTPINAPGQAARVVVPAIPPRNEPQPKVADAPNPAPRAPREEPKHQAPAPVILDVDVPREQPKTSVSATQTPPPVEQRAAQPAQPRFALVAVLPDGKTALFTDPQTRLPVQYKVGDKLTNGEIVKAIDAKAGKVTTDKKIYVLE